MGLLDLLTNNNERQSLFAEGPLCDDPCAEHMLRTGGYCKLLSDVGQWEEDAISAASELMRSEMAFVPSGPVQLQNVASFEGSFEDCGVCCLDEDAFFIDRHVVTNSQFKRFVDADAYRDESFWPEVIQPLVFQFVDSTGVPGPAQWADGNYLPEKRDHPVVGISWHEANAFANWIGKRLPTSSQWQRAGTWWNMATRYPWGSSFQQNRANTFASGVGDTVSVRDYEKSATPNGILQLVGNVWEWVDACFTEVEFEGRMTEISESLGEIRGGAFDTYLASQATCVFRSGQSLLARQHNVGFRCAAGADLLARGGE